MPQKDRDPEGHVKRSQYVLEYRVTMLGLAVFRMVVVL